MPGYVDRNCFRKVVHIDIKSMSRKNRCNNWICEKFPLSFFQIPSTLESLEKYTCCRVFFFLGTITPFIGGTIYTSGEVFSQDSYRRCKTKKKKKNKRERKKTGRKTGKGRKMDSRRIVRGIFEIYHSAGSVNFAESIKRPDELIKNFPRTNLLWDRNPLNWRSFI